MALCIMPPRQAGTALGRNCLGARAIGLAPLRRGWREATQDVARRAWGNNVPKCAPVGHARVKFPKWLRHIV
eukprot:1441077-Alexandrium_andersonii.AAC.1